MHEFSVVWVGFHEEGRYALEEIYDNGFPVKAVLTLDDEETRKRSGAWSYEAFCKKCNIPLHKIKNINDDQVVELLNVLKPSVMCVIGWSQILKKPALDAAELVVGTHASLLPNNRGSAPINWALINGEKKTGNTLLVLSEGVDSGDILAQRAFDITPFDSCKSLYDKVAETNADMLIELLKKVRSGILQPVVQREVDEKILARRRPQDGLISWEQGSAQVYDFIRALTEPYPGAFTFYHSNQIIVWKVSWSPDDETTGEPGSLARVCYSFIEELCSVAINCSKGCIYLHEIEIQGKGRLIGTALVQFFNEFEGFGNG